MTETIPKCFPANEELRTFIFFREGGVWYPIGLPPSTVADNAERNPGRSASRMRLPVRLCGDYNDGGRAAIT